MIEASRLTKTFMVSLPSYLVAWLAFGIDLPASPSAAVGFILSLIAAFLLVFCLDFFIGRLSFWTFSVWGLTYAKVAVLNILAGSIIPLSLFPDWLRQIALVLPFQGMAYKPLAIYIGEIQGGAIWTSIGGQLAWAVVLMGLTMMVWRVSIRHYQSTGS